MSHARAEQRPPIVYIGRFADPLATWTWRSVGMTDAMHDRDAQQHPDPTDPDPAATRAMYAYEAGYLIGVRVGLGCDRKAARYETRR